jgi:hypothetical protein
LRVATWDVARNERDEGPEQASAQLDQQHVELEAAWRQAIATAGVKALDQAVGPQLAQVVAQLAEPLVPLREPVAGEQAGVDLARGPVGQEGAGLEQGFEQTDHPVVLQLQARDTALARPHQACQGGPFPGVHGAGQQLGLRLEVAQMEVSVFAPQLGKRRVLWYVGLTPVG